MGGVRDTSGPTLRPPPSGCLNSAMDSVCDGWLSGSRTCSPSARGAEGHSGRGRVTTQHCCSLRGSTGLTFTVMGGVSLALLLGTDTLLMITLVTLSCNSCCKSDRPPTVIKILPLGHTLILCRSKSGSVRQP